MAVAIAAGPVFGVVNQVFGRASKYSLFDPCKEMLFITMADKRVRGAKGGGLGGRGAPPWGRQAELPVAGVWSLGPRHRSCCPVNAHSLWC
jgi:hypothetical protein